MIRRTIAAATLALASACARGPVRPVTVHLDPGEGTMFVTDHETGDERVCSTECRGTAMTRTRLDLVLAWPRPDGVDYAAESFTVSRELSIRGEWNDRSGLRIAGGVILFLGVTGGAGLAGWGGSLLARGGRALDGLGAGILIFFGSAIGAAAIGVGSALLGLRDHARIRRGPLGDATVMLVPTDDGAVLTLGGSF